VVRKKDQFYADKSREEMLALKKGQQVKELMKQFNQLYKEGKYKEAELAAQKAHELDPDDPSTEAAVKLAQIHGAVTTYEDIQKRKTEMTLSGLNDAENPGPVV